MNEWNRKVLLREEFMLAEAVRSAAKCLKGDFPTFKDCGIENLILDHNNKQQHIWSSV